MSTTYTFESEIATALILDATMAPDAWWDPTDLCEAVTNTIREVFPGCTITIDPPEAGDFVTVTAPRNLSPLVVEDRIRQGVWANQEDDEA